MLRSAIVSNLHVIAVSALVAGLSVPAAMAEDASGITLEQMDAILARQHAAAAVDRSRERARLTAALRRLDRAEAYGELAYQRAAAEHARSTGLRALPRRAACLEPPEAARLSAAGPPRRVQPPVPQSGAAQTAVQASSRLRRISFLGLA